MVDHDKDIIAAHHEAGHAVGAYVLGVPTNEVYITAGSGEGDWKPALTIGDIRERDLWREHAICGELGRAVERRLFGQHDAGFCKDDEEVIDRLLLTFLNDENERMAFKSRLPKLAEDVIERPFFIDAVRALAQELLKGVPLKGVQVAALLEALVSRPL